MKTLRNVMIATFGLLIGLLILAIFLIVRDAQPEPEPQPVADTNVVAPTAAAQLPAATNTPVIVGELPTITPFPTDIPTETPIPTDTPVPTETPVPTDTPVPTNPPPPPPTAVPPTNTPLPPTETPAPAGPAPVNANGLFGRSFVLQDWRTSTSPGGQIWYEWNVGNSSGGGVPYSTLGVMPRRNGVDEVQWYQNNWGGNNDVMPTEGLSWPSWMSIPEAGDYTLRVVVCFDGFDTCLNGGGTFHTLSQEIPISIR